MYSVNFLLRIIIIYHKSITFLVAIKETYSQNIVPSATFVIVRKRIIPHLITRIPHYVYQKNNNIAIQMTIETKYIVIYI